jgi:DNA-binding transcriptional MocR family regulator
VLSLLDRYRKEATEIPNLSYLARYFRVHHSTMQEHLSELHRKGYLRAPVPGPPIREVPALPPLPIPPRDEDDVHVEATRLAAPGARGPVTIEKRTLPGHTAPSVVVVRTRTRTRFMEVLRRGGDDGPITGFKVVEEVEG